MGLYNPSNVGNSFCTSSTATPTSVAAATTSNLLLAVNPSRKGATFLNNSTANLYLDFEETSSASAYAVKISSGGYYELPFCYTGAIAAIWDAANGSVFIRELT